MLLLTLIILSLAFTIAGQILKKGWLAFAGAGAWMITAIQSFSESLTTWDVYFNLGFLFIGLTLACAFSPLAWRETTSSNEMPEEPDVADIRAEIEAFKRERNQYAGLYENRQPKRRRW